MQTITVPANALTTLLRWCEDAIDFHDDSDDAAAKAWEALTDALQK
jgi:hypothetical protein